MSPGAAIRANRTPYLLPCRPLSRSPPTDCRTLDAHSAALWPALCVFLHACASGSTTSPQGSYPGASDAPRSTTTRSDKPPTKARLRWERFDEVMAWAPLNARFFPSAGHFGGQLAVRIRVSPDARTAYEALVPGSELPAGTVVAAFHSALRDGRPARVLAMVKGERDWEYLSLDAEGRIDERGALPLCIRCHSEGVADQLFGLPKPTKAEAGSP